MIRLFPFTVGKKKDKKKKKEGDREKRKEKDAAAIVGTSCGGSNIQAVPIRNSPQSSTGIGRVPSEGFPSLNLHRSIHFPIFAPTSVSTRAVGHFLPRDGSGHFRLSLGGTKGSPND